MMDRTARLQDEVSEFVSRCERRELWALEVERCFWMSERQIRRCRRRYEEDDLQGWSTDDLASRRPDGCHVATDSTSQ